MMSRSWSSASASAQSQQQSQTPAYNQNQSNQTSSSQSSQSNQTTTAASGQDRDFIMNAAQANMLQQQIANLADKNAQNDQVKDLVPRIRNNAKDTDDRLTDFASRNNVTLPTSLDAQHQQIYNRLAGLTGTDFDKQFVKTEADLQDKIASLYRTESQNGQNQEIRNYASSQMNSMNQLQQQTRNLEQTMGATASNMPATQPGRSKPASQTGTSGETSGRTLPKTAGELPLLALMGCLSIAVSTLMRFASKRS